MILQKIIHKLEDFRLLPFFVIISMVIGIWIGKNYGISDYQLTPPIDAIKNIFVGNYDFTLPNILALGIVIGLFMMMYPAMTNIRLDEFKTAFRSYKQLSIVVFFNYAVAPFFMFFLAKIFLSNESELFTGLVLYGIAPCIAMVIVFTFLAKGNTPLALVLVAVNSVIQMILIPFYTKLLLGQIQFDVLVVAKSVLLYLGLPLVLGFLTRKIGIKKIGEAGFEKFKSYLNAISIIGLLFTLIVMFALKGDLILTKPQIILKIAVPITIFFVVIFMVVYLVAWKFKLNYQDSVAVAFNSTGRDFEIAIAIAITAFDPLVALATVVGPLIEVPIMLALVWLAKTLEPRLFKTKFGAPIKEELE